MSDPAAPAQSSNPLEGEWRTRFGMPPFGAIAPEHFAPAIERAIADHRAAIERIGGSAEVPTFDNTIAALEKSGEQLARVVSAFFVLAGANTNDALEAIERNISPKLALHGSEVFQHTGLFRRVDTLFAARDAMRLDAEQGRVLERYYKRFVRAGAALGPAERARMSEISERLAALGTTFGQNVLADEKRPALVLESEEDLAGLPDFLRDAARKAADERELPGRYVITLARSSIEPFLQFSTRRDLREKAWRAWSARGDVPGEHDNNPLVTEMVTLRLERAKLLGFESFAQFRLEDAMAKSPENVRAMLRAVWGPARAAAMRDREALEAIAQEEGANHEIAPWDWRFYSEKLRRARFALDEAEIKPYFQLERMIEAAFDVAHRLFGLTFVPVGDAPTYHPDVRVWDVRGSDGRHVGVFTGDYFARASKRSGAWMTSLRDQERLAGEIRPIIVNVMNFSKPEAGKPALLSFDDARTLFHECGHALHGLLSNVTYPLLSGTAVATDFVEFPSQLYEHWLEQPEVLGRYATHHETGEPMSPALLERLLAARNFNQGFTTVEYLASAIVDHEFHTLTAVQKLDARAFEREALARIDMPDAITMRHRTPHFTHVFTGGGYAAAYYSYMWSEMLDADGFAAFRERGDIFDTETARRLRDYVYAAGNTRDPAEAYRLFRGALPKVEAILKQRGFQTPSPAA